MILKDISLSSPEDNILFDETLFFLADKGMGGEVLRFWESPNIFIVLGRIGNEQEDINASAVQKDHIPVLRRTSGGGTVVQGQGCLNYTLILSKDSDPALADLRKSYQWISSKVIDALQTLNVEAVFRPISDIALLSNEKKFSGNAQRRGKNYILHHGTILYDFNLRLIPQYLKMPKDIPEYRRGRLHNEFVTNITVNPKNFKLSLHKQFSIEREEPFLSPQEQTMLAQIKSKNNILVNTHLQ